jgi:putative nucleotidyltransferase with HDIG domain
MLMTLPRIEIDNGTFLKEQFVLPALPSTLMQVMQVMQSEVGGAAQVTEVISRDASMVSHILRVVNSAYYALPKPIGNLQHAIAYIGLGEVSRICLTLSVINTLKPKDKNELQHFWHHSYLCALIAKRLVREVRNVPDIGDLYAAALLHDIGKLVYVRFFSEHFLEMRRFSAARGRFLWEAEQHFDLPSHRLFGALLCDHWSLPQTIRRACEAHELPDLQSFKERPDAGLFELVITVSNLIAALSTENLEEPLKEEVTTEIKAALGIGKEELLKFLGDVYDLKCKAETTIGPMV